MRAPSTDLWDVMSMDAPADELLAGLSASPVGE